LGFYYYVQDKYVCRLNIYNLDARCVLSTFKLQSLVWTPTCNKLHGIATESDQKTFDKGYLVHIDLLTLQVTLAQNDASTPPTKTVDNSIALSSITIDKAGAYIPLPERDIKGVFVAIGRIDQTATRVSQPGFTLTLDIGSTLSIPKQSTTLETTRILSNVRFISMYAADGSFVGVRRLDERCYDLRWITLDVVGKRLLGVTVTSDEPRLVSIDITTGRCTNIARLPSVETSQRFAADFEPISQTLFLVGPRGHLIAYRITEQTHVLLPTAAPYVAASMISYVTPKNSLLYELAANQTIASKLLADILTPTMDATENTETIVKRPEITVTPSSVEIATDEPVIVAAPDNGVASVNTFPFYILAFCFTLIIVH